MKNLILLTLLFILVSCINKQNVEQLSRENELSIFTYGAPWENQFEAFFNPNEISKDTLFISKIENDNGKQTKSLEKIKLNPNEIDSLYTYFQKIKNNFKLDKRKNRVMDGTSVGISISNNTTSLSYSYRGLEKAENADPEIGKLIRFINTRLPKNFQMY
jgi:hypothetical protein